MLLLLLLLFFHYVRQCCICNKLANIVCEDNEPVAKQRGKWYAQCAGFAINLDTFYAFISFLKCFNLILFFKYIYLFYYYSICMTFFLLSIHFFKYKCIYFFIYMKFFNYNYLLGRNSENAYKIDLATESSNNVYKNVSRVEKQIFHFISRLISRILK